MPEVTFASDGSPVIAQHNENNLFTGVLDHLLELEGKGTTIPTQAISEYEKLVSTPEGQKQLIEAYLAEKIKSLTPDARQELVESLQSLQADKPIVEDAPTAEDSVQALQDADVMEEFAKKSEQVIQTIEASDYPNSVKEFILMLLNSQRFSDAATWMKWSEESQNLQDAHKQS
jgi:hypothetical protein